MTDQDASAEGMTEEEAEALCLHLASTHPDRSSHQWLPRRRADGLWEVAKVALPPPLDTLTGEVRGDERPETPDDPRTAQQQNVPWPY
jgi:hypothetical protein